MATIDLTAESFNPTVDDNDIVLVDWWASWCQPCLRFGPVFEKSSQKHTDVVFAKVDTEDQKALAGQAGITSIPTLMAFRKGVLVFAQPGALPPQALEQVITQVRELDMAEVHKVASEQAAAQQTTGEQPAEPGQSEANKA